VVEKISSQSRAKALKISISIGQSLVATFGARRGVSKQSSRVCAMMAAWSAG
jgi:hypothetical protein